jgi:hypothetical protein
LTTETGKSWFTVEAMLSFVMHAALLGACAWYFRNPLTANIIAAGDGQGSGEAIEVSTVDGKALGFTPFRPVSMAGEDASKPNNVDVSTEARLPDPNAEVLPSTNPTPPPKDSLTTDRPTVKSPQIVSQDPLRGGTTNNKIEMGRTMGSPVPALTAGVGVNSAGVNLSGNEIGVPGGSAYGRLIQGILARNYNPPTTNDISGEQFVIVQLRIARDGRILSVVNGRVAPNHFKRRSANSLINNAVERAVIAASAQGLPAFPNGFLMGAQEAVAEVWFKYPK